ncbi:leucine zipper putative tumor suppressor 3-like [Ornithodoros turicata]|uniref:leucine zipper putative tumor suppressor 3-like n=1 Tax=Ornithodoros turicata TaxID=34597 RepID=UPI00313A37A4
MASSPPCLPPVSGVLVVMNPQVIKPVAFRAVQHDGSMRTNSPTGGYYFAGYHSAPLQRPNSVLKRISFHRSMPHLSGANNVSDGMDSGHSSALLPDEVSEQLRVKDVEIARLRQTLEDNERAIINVYEEKEEKWRLEMENLKKHYEGLLQQQVNERSHHPTPREDDPQHLREALYQCRQELDNMVQGFREERSCWLKEKAKVLQYQRQLQLSYWQMLDDWS